MSAFWSAWVMILVTLNLGLILFLFFWAQSVKIPTAPDGTSGHLWGDGVREGLHSLPRWWALLSILAFIATFGYLVLYPGFGASKGLIGWTSHDQLAKEVAANDAKLGPILKDFDSRSIPQLAGMPEAQHIGRRLFIDNCAACHGMDAHGGVAIGAPDLTDSDWLWGGTPDDILTTILDGRTGIMPPFGASMSEQQVDDVANYVLSLSNSPHSAAQATAGQTQFAVCSACHGADGKGNPMLGAPNLTYPKRLYGSDIAMIETTIKDGRTGTMPAWRERLGETDVRLISAWVYAQSQHPATETAAN